MRNLFLSIMMIIGAAAVFCEAAEGQQPPPKVLSPSDTSLSEAEKSVRASADAFVATFNKGDAKAIGSMWTADCEFVDETGRIFRGRKAIEEQYAAFFAANPGLKMETTISSLRMVSGSVAIEEGRSVVKSRTGVPVSKGSYRAVLLKDDGKWLMASVREHATPSLSLRPTFEDLEWLIGQWESEQDGKKVSLTAKWIAERRFIEITYLVSNPDGGVRSGVQIIGRDPSSGQVASWSFDSNGGYGRGQWKVLKKGCIIESWGVLLDGAPTTSTDMVSIIDQNRLRWQSVNRELAGKRLNDSQPVVLQRRAQ